MNGTVRDKNEQQYRQADQRLPFKNKEGLEMTW